MIPPEPRLGPPESRESPPVSTVNPAVSREAPPDPSSIPAVGKVQPGVSRLAPAVSRLIPAVARSILDEATASPRGRRACRNARTACSRGGVTRSNAGPAFRTATTAGRIGTPASSRCGHAPTATARAARNARPVPGRNRVEPVRLTLGSRGRAQAEAPSPRHTRTAALHWPTIPASTVAAALALKAEIATPAGLAAYKAKLPANAQGAGTVLIVHTHPGATTPFASAAAYSVVSSDGELDLSFDPDGKPITTPF